MWTTLGDVAPSHLTGARSCVHWACQLPAAATAGLIEARPHFSHTNLGWERAVQALVGHPVNPGEEVAVRAGVRIKDLTLVVVRGTDVTTEFPLAGRTLDDGRAWLAKALADTLDADVAEFSLFEHELPGHPVQTGAAFDIEGVDAALAELALWLANTHDLLELFVHGDKCASEVRLWPHHFDMTSLLTLVADDDPDKAKSINVGVSFGDDSYAQPYAYVSPWPHAPEGEAPSLTLGHWHKDGFFAAVLEGDVLVSGGAEGQAQRAEAFFVQAGDLSRTMLGLPPVARRKAKLVWYKAAETDELREGRVKSVTAGHRGVCLTRHQGCYAALTNACPHQGGPLGEGSIEKGWLRCPWHGWDFHPRTGQSPGDLEDGLETFPVEVRTDGVYVGVQAEAPHVRDVSDVMAETMTNWGVRWVFGMVGHSNLGLADALRRRVEAGTLGYIGIRHEGAASFAVSAYGKLTGRPAACLAIAGPGATNLLTGLWDAHVDRAPALALTGQVQTQVLGRGAFQEIDLKAAYGGVAQFTGVVLHGSNFAELMSLACKKAILGRGVSHLVFPDEVQTHAAADTPAGTPEGRMPDLNIAPATASLDAAESALKAAKRPVIIVGHGARFSMDAVRDFADAFGIPVITTFKAKGQISDSHALGCGVLGRSGTPVASWFMNEADLLLVLGSSFSNHTGITDYKTIVQVDFEAEALGRRHAVNVPVLGEIGITLDALQSRMSGHDGFEDQRTEVSERWRIWRAEKRSRLSDEMGKGLNSAAIFDALTRKAPADAIMAVDVGNNAYSFGRYFESREHTILMSGYLGSIGFALPAAMGAWAATQEDDPRFRGRKVISISGDGGLGQYLADLTTWVKYDMNITHVVLNNGELGKISKEQRVGGWDVWETSLRNPGFAKFARNCGALGIEVRTLEELEAALDQALSHDGPALIEVLSDALLF
ncbi:MAG: Rieske 2Fe-2S domain-containing protein [Nannocystaceae bacterium]|nr:Rieske 2Fe-2S domain-containing protein [Nannocystaceae bacterium]